MKTKPISQTEPPALTLTSRCKVFTNGQELDFSMLGALYATVLFARQGLPQEVFYQDGTLLLRHDGAKTLESMPEFEAAVVSFSEFMLVEQNRGYELYQAEAERLRSSNAEAKAPAAADDSEPVEPPQG